MTTKRLYYDDAFAREFTAEVLSCEPGTAAAPQTPSNAPAGALWRVKLNRTAFYPTSGGQPHDTGQLGDARVVEVLDEEDEVTHVVDKPVAIGPVQGIIDWERRFDHIQQHTGQHVLSAVFHSRFALPTVSFHLGTDICTIDIRGQEPTQEILDSAMGAANDVVYADRPVNVKYGSAEELAAAGVRKTVDRIGTLRAIAIESLELQPCGGTHVQRTGQIGMIWVRGVSRIRQDWRVEFACGRRAERLARADFAALRAVAQRLNCSPQEADSGAERVIAERDANFKSAKASIQKLAEMDARAYLQEVAVGAGGLRVVAKLFETEPQEYVQGFARELAQAENTVALLVHIESGLVFFSQHPTAKKNMNALLAESLKRVAGKGGGSCDFARGRLADPQRASEFLRIATAVLRPA
ncbi:MAG TPA: alanyl-tRNA editing protein [Candidatus Acidoferrum sp.]|jgi:alanyl-tRNA synthetase|nr:alanyl-tRNA editing protein [Candidatus Acidoferrum sp.]